MQRHAIFFGMALGLVALGTSSCGRKARKEATSLKPCKTSRDCTKPNKCIRYAKGKGICARRCTLHSDCPKPLRCTGEYSLVKYGTFKVGRTRFFCRPANRGEGESCTDIKHGCKKGLGCVAGKCYRGCATVEDCAQDKTCVTLNKLKKVCLAATLADGAKCKPRGMVRCQRGLRCYAGSCVRPCGKKVRCPAGQRCAAEGFVGINATLSRRLGRPSFLFCETARDAQKEALARRRCQRQRNCSPPNRCMKLKRGAVCVHPCAADDQCPKPWRCTGSYKPKIFSKKRVRFCRAADRKRGQTCGGTLGCATGNRCYGGKCHPECRTPKDCASDAKCIRIVYGIKVPGKRRKTAYRVCLPATGAAGAACKTGKVPYCKRGHRCHKDRCVQTCKKNGDCKKGQACKGTGYGFVGKRFKPIYKFCK